MNNRQNEDLEDIEVELDDSAKSKKNPEEELQLSTVLETANGGALISEFGTLYSSSAFQKFNEMLMAKARYYFFSVALFLNLIKFGFAVYKYFKESNKNLASRTGLGWQALQFALIITAILGSIVAAATFVLVTPILFVVAMGSDTLRNFGLLLWNSISLAKLRYSLRGKLEDPLVELKYKNQKDLYLENIKHHSIATGVGILMTLAVSFIYLFPHAGAAAVAFGAATVTIGAFKTSVAGIFGFLATGAMVADFALPPAIKGIKKLINYSKPLVNAVKKLFGLAIGLFASSPAPAENEPLLVQQPAPAPVPAIAAPLAPKPKYKLDTLVKHRLDHNGFFANNFREVIVNHIKNKEVARLAIMKMAKNKIESLKKDMLDGSDYQQVKRQEKVNALELIRAYMNDPSFEYTDPKSNVKMKFPNSMQVVLHINRNFPEVDNSFFKHESDTRNVVKALLQYYMNFEEAEVTKTKTLSQVEETAESKVRAEERVQLQQSA